LTASLSLVALLTSAVGTFGTAHAASGWFQQNVTTPAPGPMVYDTKRHVAFLFNGTESWQWSTSGATWTQMSPAHQPLMLGGDFAMAFDSTRGVAVLIVSPFPQGYPIVTNFLTTWEWDGTDWVQKQPAHSPTARFARSQNLAFDSQRSVTVLFSGEFNIQNPQLRTIGDTWEWNGIDWTQNTTAGGSIMRDGHCMTYDSIRHRVVLHGGEENHGSGTSGLFFDTWEYDGTSWSVSTDSNTFFPYAFMGCSLSYDPVIGRTIELVGGTAGLHTFYWDGTSWAEVGPLGAGLVTWRSTYDSDNNAVVVIGSTSFSGVNQTWLLNPLPPPGVAPLPAISSISPDHGSTEGGTQVTITGLHFTGATFVSFRAGSTGLQPCLTPFATQYCFTVVSDTQITAKAPPLFISQGDIYVVTPAGFSANTPADVFTFEGWDRPTPTDGQSFEVPRNPRQPFTFTLKLVEKGKAQIGHTVLPGGVTCTDVTNPASADFTAAQVDCSVSPTTTGLFRISFSDAADPAVTSRTYTVQAEYQPNPDGYSFGNTNDPSPTYASMAADYPSSAWEMYFPGGAPTKLGADFFLAFEWTMQGLCYGYATSSAFFYKDSSLRPLEPSNVFGNIDSTLPFTFDNQNPAYLRTLVERYHSRQLAQVGAYEALKQYNLASAIGNAGVFDQLVGQLTTGPVTVALAPSKSVTNAPRWGYLFGISHMVVAYEIPTPGQKVIAVYDPNSPQAVSLLTVDASGGVTLSNGTAPPSYGGHSASGQDLGGPNEWQLVPQPDFTWLDGSSEPLGTGPLTIDNKHWLLDLGQVPYVFVVGALTNTIPLHPVFVERAAAGTQGMIEQLGPGGAFSGSIATSSTNASVGQFSGNHVAIATETDSGAVGTSHSIDIDTSSRSVHLSQATTLQQYTLQLGADFLPNYGRQVTLTGVSLAPNTSVDFKTDSSINGFTVSTSGASQLVPATIEQAGQSASSSTVQVSIPGGGSQASITVVDWTDVAHSLIYETTLVNGQSTVTILQDNPAQRPAAIDALFQQLTATINTISDPDLRQGMLVAVQVAQALVLKGDHKTAVKILIGLEVAAKILSTKGKIPNSTANAIISLSQQIRGLL
jgi:hypothetical protein